MTEDTETYYRRRWKEELYAADRAADPAAANVHRSLATQLNAFFIMIALLLFGGETIRQFIFFLFAGLLTGSYSSLFTAVPLLEAWEKGEIPFTRPWYERREDRAEVVA